MIRDPFAGGRQTVADRMPVVMNADLETLQAILARDDLQSSVRRQAEKRCRRLHAKREHRRNMGWPV